MAFLTGRATFLRFRVDGPAPRQFGEDHLDSLNLFLAGRSRLAAADGVETGWAAGDHVLDADFQLEKNVVNDALAFDLRIDTEKLPADRLKAYYAVELKALSANNPSGLPSARQKREAKEVARDRLEQEGKDGRFRKQTLVPVLWDARSNEVLYGATSLTHVERFTMLFKQTFGLDLTAVSAGSVARGQVLASDADDAVLDVTLSAFVPDVTPDEAAWVPDMGSRDFVGNEFLMWLWFNSEGESDTVTVADGSEVTYMIARTLSLACPRNHTGTETFSHEGPSRLPEAKRGAQSGKLPRRLGLTVVRHDEQYELTLDAETLGVSSAKLPAPDDDVKTARAKAEDRVDRVRHLVETLDLFFGAFGADRFGAKWADTLPQMQRWLARAERRAVPEPLEAVPA